MSKTANKHRNEWILKIAGKTYKGRVTLELLEAYEEQFLDKQPKASLFYRIVGWWLAHSDVEITAEDGADLAFNELGLEKTKEAAESILVTAYKTGDQEEEAEGNAPKAKG